MDGYLNFFFLFRARIHSRVLTRVAFDGHFSSTNTVNDNRNNNCHERENNTILKFLLNFQRNYINDLQMMNFLQKIR